MTEKTAEPIKVSVAMAVYNGEKYIKKQIDSILEQLDYDDELIISYNDSNDNTLNIIHDYKKNDRRVKCVLCREKGVIPNFNNALNNTTGDIIYLADQDDVWEPLKVAKINSALKDTDNHIELVLHNYSSIDADGVRIDGDLFKRRNVRKGIFRNIIKNSYQGCCMAFNRKVLDVAFPVPQNVPMHDQWIGLCAEKTGDVLFYDEPLIQYRKHGNNVSHKHVGMIKKIEQVFVISTQFILRCIMSK